jgi:F-type H+-transporting ATPase subunit gamma
VAALAKGRQGERYLRRRTNAEILSAEGWTRAGVTAEEVDRLYGLVIGWFMSGDYDEVWCTHTQFFSPVRRYPRAVRLLPIAPEEVGPPRVAGEHGASTDRWFYEPGLGVTVGEMLAVFLKLQIEDVLLGSFAAEQGARMITMQEAAERADKTLRELVVRYNRLRRESITTDLLGLLFATRLREGEVVEGNPGTVT